MIIKGTFTSVWDTDTLIETPAELDTETGEISTESVEADDVDILEREYFTDDQGNEFEVCTECHNFILKSVMKEGIGKTLNEVQVCSDPECENN